MSGPYLKILLSFSLIATASCREKLLQKEKLNQRGKYTPRGEPVEIDDAISSERAYFQTRNPIVLNFSSEILSKGDHFSLNNESTEETLINNEIASDYELSRSLSLTASSDENLSGWEISIKFFPLDSELTGKFGYGKNKLRILVDNGKSGKTDELTIVREDFTFFSAASSRYVDETNARVNELEVLPSEQAKGVLTNGVHRLVLDPIDLMVK